MTVLPVPIIAADLWLDRAAFEDIQALVSRMQMRMEQDERPLPFPPRETLLGVSIKANGGEPTPRQIRGAAYLGTTPGIVLDPFPCFDEDAAPLKADREGFRRAMLGVLAHEASHIMQWTVGRDESAHAVSGEASRTARASKNYDDYIAYLATPLELAAHSTQLAVEIWASEGDSVGHADFEAAAVRSGLWSHMTDHPDSPPVCQESGASAFARVREPLLENGWWIYQRLTA